MDTMIQSYMEETEEMLQRAEECIIRLEMEYSSVDVNELFRIAHTIKGSSHMVGYEDIGNLMHKIEDMLDCVRNGSIAFEQSIVMLCFEGLDTVKKMLIYKKEQSSQEMPESLVHASSRISEMTEAYLKANNDGEVKHAVEQQEIGFVSSLLNKKTYGNNRFFVTFFIEEDAPMVSPVVLMILNTVDEVGTLVYSSLGDDYFSGSKEINDIKTFEIILSTNIDEAELYTYFALCYIEKINIVDLSRSRLETNDYYFGDEEYNLHLINLWAIMLLNRIIIGLKKEIKVDRNDIEKMMSLRTQTANAFAKKKCKDVTNKFITDLKSICTQVVQIYDGQVSADEKLCADMQEQMGKLIERAHNYIKGKHIVSIFRAEKDGFIDRFYNFIGMLNKSSVVILLIDLSSLTILKENEVKDLIHIKRQLASQDMEIGIIVDGFDARRIINIFDSISPLEEFSVYKSETDAILGILASEHCYQKINHRVKDVQNVE